MDSTNEQLDSNTRDFIIQIGMAIEDFRERYPEHGAFFEKELAGIQAFLKETGSENITKR